MSKLSYLQSIMAQYNLSDDASRKEFLDALFAHLEKEGKYVRMIEL